MRVNCASPSWQMSQTHPINSTLSHHTHVKIITYIVVSVWNPYYMYFVERWLEENLQIYCLFVGISYSTMCCGLQRLAPEYGREFSFSNPYLVLKPGLKKADAVRSAFPHNTQDVVWTKKIESSSHGKERSSLLHACSQVAKFYLTFWNLKSQIITR